MLHIMRQNIQNGPAFSAADVTMGSGYFVTFLLGLLLFASTGSAAAQVFEPGDEPRTVRTRGFWENWFVQMGLDMTLQNPYGYDFSKVFPNGNTFGLDLAVGKWFSHQVGVRGKFNWENKLDIFLHC